MSLTIEDLVYGEDGEQPLRETIQGYLQQAKGDEVRLRIEIRSRMKGTTKSQQERVFEIDPNVSNVDAVMQTIDKALKDSPGEDFTGQIRINFSQAGTSQRYGSFSRNVRATYADAPDTIGLRNNFAEDDDFDGDNTIGDLQESPRPMGVMNLGMSYPSMAMGSGGPVNNEDMRAWLETAMNFTFRSMAQQQQMFERAMQMVESLHFGLARPIEPGIIEQKGGSSNSESGPGLIGALINTAAQLAKADNPGEAIAAAAQLASGAAQPTPGAARQVAIQKAGQAVKQLTTRRNATPFDDDLDAYDEDMDPEDFPMGPDGPDNNNDDDGGAAAEPDWENLDNDEVKEGFLRWVRADPSRKKAVMDMLPELSKEVL